MSPINIEGNIGSCHIKSSTYPVTVIKAKTVAVNSCTGEIVDSNIHLSDFIPIVVILLAASISIMLILKAIVFWVERND